MTNNTENTLEGCSADKLLFWDLPFEATEVFATHEDAAPIVYDLDERTSRFGEQIIIFAKKIAWNPVNYRLIDQLVGAGTSVGAKYCEADDGISHPDFRHRFSICHKEARETKFFLRMVSTAEPSLKSEARELWKEAHSLHLIFRRIWRSTKP